MVKLSPLDILLCDVGLDIGQRVVAEARELAYLGIRCNFARHIAKMRMFGPPWLVRL